MGTIGQVVADLVALLAGAGVPAGPDRAALTPPCVWVPPQRVEWDTLTGSSVPVRVLAVAVDAGDTGSLAQLDSLVTAVNAALPLVDARPTTVVWSGPDVPPLPGYELTTHVRMTTDC